MNDLKSKNKNGNSEMLKTEIVGMGYMEIITFGLTKIAEQTIYLKRDVD